MTKLSAEAENLNKTIKVVLSRLNLNTELRGYEFIKQLILSGDVFLEELKSPIIRKDENSEFDESYKITQANLWVYEPYHKAKALEARIEELEARLVLAEKLITCPDSLCAGKCLRCTGKEDIKNTLSKKSGGEKEEE